MHDGLRSRGGLALPTATQIALKEWAVTVGALGQGQQVLLLRKGGIREEGKEFRVLYPHFLLYPSFEHQREELITPPWHHALQETLANTPGPERVTFSHFAQVHEIYEVTEQAKVNALAPLYLWTTTYAQKRLHWKPRKPLSVVVVRAYRMREPVTVPVLPQYAGCTSWVPLAQEVHLGELTPVLSEQEFLLRAAEVRRILEQAPVAAPA